MGDVNEQMREFYMALRENGITPKEGSWRTFQEFEDETGLKRYEVTNLCRGWEAEREQAMQNGLRLMSQNSTLLQALNVALLGIDDWDSSLPRVRERVLELVCDGAGYVTCERCPRVGTQEDVIEVDGAVLCAECRGEAV